MPSPLPRRHATRIACAAVAGMILSGLALGGGAISRAARAQSADLNGLWSNGTAPITIHQRGRDVRFEYIAPDFAHHFSGVFVAPDVVEGHYAPRRDRRTGCETTMAVRIQVLNPSQFVLSWRALDSNCDLQEGQTGQDAVYSRL